MPIVLPSVLPIGVPIALPMGMLIELPIECSQGCASSRVLGRAGLGVWLGLKCYLAWGAGGGYILFVFLERQINPFMFS